MLTTMSAREVCVVIDGGRKNYQHKLQVMSIMNVNEVLTLMTRLDYGSALNFGCCILQLCIY